MAVGLVIITDEFPYKNAAGIGQAMFNFFSDYPGNLWVFMPDTETLPPKTERLPATPVVYPGAFPKPLTNRFGRWINPWLMPWQFANRMRLAIPSQLPLPQECLVVVATTSPHKLQMAWLLLQKGGYTVVPFFMDDWLAANSLSWQGGSVQQIARDLLTKAPGIIAISLPLANILSQRYHLPPKPILVLQNPAMENKAVLEGEKPVAGRLLYAGSVWPMHADALIALAKAIHYLHHQGQTGLTLSIYCPTAHRKKHQAYLEGPGVTWAGWMPEAGLVRTQYPKAWLLVCCASFLPENEAYSKSSIQSKISDYMAAARPVLYVGPKGGASDAFLENWNCGYFIHSPFPETIAEGLLSIYSDELGWRSRSDAAFKAATNKLSPRVIQKELYDFLSKCTPNTANPA